MTSQVENAHCRLELKPSWHGEVELTAQWVIEDCFEVQTETQSSNTLPCTGKMADAQTPLCAHKNVKSSASLN